MKFSIKSQILRDGINKILSVVDKKNSRPILTNCLITTENNNLSIIATDLEVSAKILLNADIVDPGTFCINTKSISEILKELPDAIIELEISDQNILKLHCNNINYSLLITNSEEYPTLAFENKNNTFKLKSSQVLNIINKTSHAISTDETRLYLNGIFLQTIDNKLRSVAIDGHRLALLDTNEFLGEAPDLTDGVIIPRKGITELKKVADAYINKDITLSIDDSFLYVNAEDKYLLSVRLIARDYPKYQTVIPNKTSYSLNLDRKNLLNAVKRIRILSNEKTNGIKMAIENNELTLSANHPSLGNAIEKITVNYTGEPLDIGFNAKYLIESLSVFDDNEIVFEFNNELTPVVIKSEDLPEFLGIIMPLKL
jgi:DNA polymerase III subunit beta